MAARRERQGTIGRLGVYSVLVSGLISWPLSAQELPVGSAVESPVEVHGFVSQGFIKSTDNNYLTDSERGSFEFTEVGINFTKVLSEQFRVGVQLFARDLGPIGNYQPQFDFFYLDYRFHDWLGVRAGRTKLPFGLYNETSDIDAARVPILLPQSVYPIENRDFLLAQTGVELYGNVPLGAAGALEYRLYGGTIFLSTTSLAEGIGDVSVPYVLGGRVLWRPPIAGLQLGGSLQALRIDFGYEPTEAEVAAYDALGWLPPDFAGRVDFEVPVTLWVASVEYQMDELLLAAEYSRWSTHWRTTLLVRDSLDPDIADDRFYVMGSYQVRPWFTPGIYYSAWFPNDRDWTGRDARQHDLATTFRFDLNQHWLLKLETHFMHGTAALQPELNDGVPKDQLKENWLLFLAKTTAYF